MDEVCGYQWRTPGPRLSPHACVKDPDHGPHHRCECGAMCNTPAFNVDHEQVTSGDAAFDDQRDEQERGNTPPGPRRTR